MRLFQTFTDLQYFELFLKNHIKDNTKYKKIIEEVLTEAYEFSIGVKTVYTVSSKNFDAVDFLIKEVPEILKESGYTEEDYKLILEKLCSD